MGRKVRGHGKKSNKREETQVKSVEPVETEGGEWDEFIACCRCRMWQEFAETGLTCMLEEAKQIEFTCGKCERIEKLETDLSNVEAVLFLLRAETEAELEVLGRGSEGKEGVRNRRLQEGDQGGEEQGERRRTEGWVSRGKRGDQVRREKGYQGIQGRGPGRQW